MPTILHITPIVTHAPTIRLNSPIARAWKTDYVQVVNYPQFQNMVVWLLLLGAYLHLIELPWPFAAFFGVSPTYGRHSGSSYVFDVANFSL